MTPSCILIATASPPQSLLQILRLCCNHDRIGWWWWAAEDDRLQAREIRTGCGERRESSSSLMRDVERQSSRQHRDCHSTLTLSLSLSVVPVSSLVLFISLSLSLSILSLTTCLLQLLTVFSPDTGIRKRERELEIWECKTAVNKRVHVRLPRPSAKDLSGDASILLAMQHL